MDPKLTVAVGDGYLSLAQELFREVQLSLFREQQSEEARTKLKDLLQRAIKNYKKVSLNPTSDAELRKKVEANLQKARDMLHALEALEEYLAEETIPLDEVLKDEED